MLHTQKKKGTFLLLSFLLSLLILNSCGQTASDKTTAWQSETANEIMAQSDTGGNSSADFAENENTIQTSEETSAPDTKVHFIDVGQGLSVLVQDNGKNLIYDGGGRNTSSYLVSYLKEQNVDTIDYLISSHYDEDHLSGLIGCLNTFPVENVIGPDYSHDSNLYQSFIGTINEKGLDIQHPDIGDTYTLGAAAFTILAPTEIISNESNDNSIVIKINSGNISFILTGDAEHGSEAAMIDSGMDLSCDVLCVGHHGSASSTSWSFLQETVPEYAIISCGSGNSYGHPDTDTLDKLSSMEISLFRTDTQGTIVAASDGKSLTWNAEPCNDYTPGNPEDNGTQTQTVNTGSSNDKLLTSTSNNTEAEQQTVTEADDISDTQETMVWIPKTGSKYHSKSTCSNMKDSTQVTQSEAEALGYEPCKKCY